MAGFMALADDFGGAGWSHVVVHEHFVRHLEVGVFFWIPPEVENPFEVVDADNAALDGVEKIFYSEAVFSETVFVPIGHNLDEAERCTVVADFGGVIAGFGAGHSHDDTEANRVAVAGFGIDAPLGDGVERDTREERLAGEVDFGNGWLGWFGGQGEEAGLLGIVVGEGRRGCGTDRGGIEVVAGGKLVVDGGGAHADGVDCDKYGERDRQDDEE